MLVYFLNHSTAPVNLGGAERSMLRLVEDWYASDPDFEAIFITKAPRGKFIAALEERGWPFAAFRYRGWAGPSASLSAKEKLYFARDDYRATLGIIRLMETRRPDLVVTNTIVAPWAAFAAAVVGVPHAWFVREYGDLDHGLTFELGREQTFADVGRLSQAVFTNSLALKKHISQYLDGDSVTVVYPHVDAALVTAQAAEPPSAPPFPAAEAGLKVTVVGRLSDTKGQSRVIEAIGRLRDRGITASLCLVGSDENPTIRASLAARARALGIESQLTMVGEQSNPYSFVAAADVCVTPSGVEAFGRSTLEYMLVGKAVIATDGGGSPELVVPGRTGALFSADDIGQLADALAGYAADPPLAAIHGKAGRVRALKLLSSEHSNAAAIARLREAAGREPYRLPAAARYWFELPTLELQTQGGANRGLLTVIRRRIPGRIRSLLRRPVAALRHLRGR